MKYLKNIVLFFLATVAVVSCSMEDEPDYREADYGYVQFKLYKESSYDGTKSVVNQLDYLHDVTKIRVTLRYEDDLISQTLVMNSTSPEVAEYGLRSDKLRVLAGSYQVLTFALYGKLDDLIYEGTPSLEMASFDVLPGGLHVHDLTANTVERGKVRFTIVKDMSELPEVKSAGNEYTFDEISRITLSVRSE